MSSISDTKSSVKQSHSTSCPSSCGHNENNPHDAAIAWFLVNASDDATFVAPPSCHAEERGSPAAPETPEALAARIIREYPEYFSEPCGMCGHAVQILQPETCFGTQEGWEQYQKFLEQTGIYGRNCVAFFHLGCEHQRHVEANATGDEKREFIQWKLERRFSPGVSRQALLGLLGYVPGDRQQRLMQMLSSRTEAHVDDATLAPILELADVETLTTLIYGRGAHLSAPTPAPVAPAPPLDLSDLDSVRYAVCQARERGDLPDPRTDEAAACQARERGDLPDPRTDEAAAERIRDALRAAARRCPNPGPPLRLRRGSTRAVMRPACEEPSCPVCRVYLRTRALTVLTQHILAAQARGEHLYLSQLDADAAWRRELYRMRRRGVTGYAALHDHDADGRACLTRIAAGPPGAALGVRVSAREAIDLIRVAVEAWQGDEDLVTHHSDSWPMSIYDRPGEWECLGYAGTHNRKTIMDIADTVGAEVRLGDTQRTPHIVEWVALELPESATIEDGEYVDYQLTLGEVVPRAVWEMVRRAPHYGEEEEVPSPQSGARPPDEAFEPAYDPGWTPWG